MRSQNIFLSVLVAGVFATSAWAGPNEKILYNFTGGSDGAGPSAGLVSDKAGNLYGTTTEGGSKTSCDYGCGVVFELTRHAGGSWTETVLHSFDDNDIDGYNPQAGLIFDEAGNLYGTTNGGGTHDWGTVFELTPQAGGGWEETVLHSFNENGKDGYLPASSLIFDAAGNLYGTTTHGGAHDYGTVFELTPVAGGGWKETVLHSFRGKEGCNPYGALIFDTSGNLYGTTYECEQGGGGVFELMPQSGGGWTEKTLYSFHIHATDGYKPMTGLTFDGSGNLYGTTVYGGGIHNRGTVFELTPHTGGPWTETVLLSFTGGNGRSPISGLIFDVGGNLYGTTFDGGAYGPGTTFEVKPQAGGGWAETVLHSFGKGMDGSFPRGNLIFDKSGRLYGTTSGGGTTGNGAVFEIAP